MVIVGLATGHVLFSFARILGFHLKAMEFAKSEMFTNL